MTVSSACTDNRVLTLARDSLFVAFVGELLSSVLLLGHGARSLHLELRPSPMAASRFLAEADGHTKKSDGGRYSAQQPIFCPRATRLIEGLVFSIVVISRVKIASVSGTRLGTSKRLLRAEHLGSTRDGHSGLLFLGFCCPW